MTRTCFRKISRIHAVLQLTQFRLNNGKNQQKRTLERGTIWIINPQGNGFIILLIFKHVEKNK